MIHRPTHPNGRASGLRAFLPRAAFAGVMFVAIAVAATAAEAMRKNYQIAAGDAARTLPQFIEQSGEQVVYLVHNVRGVQTHAVHGEYTARAALDRMLAGTELFAVQDERTNALVVNRAADGRSRASVPQLAAASAAVSNVASDASDVSTTTTASGETVHRLPSFNVSSERDVSYVGKEALSTTRTGIALLDLPQSVKVINRAFIDDINPSLLIDTLKYVGGGQAGNINFADDRFTMRGFNAPANIGDFVDGFRAATDSNVDLALFDRLEIIKGPSAIFVANGPVGGVINKVTKNPVDYPIRTLKVQVGRFDANRAELDLGGRITADGKFIYRFTLAAHDDEGFYDHTFSQRFIFAPAVSYVFNTDTKLTLKYHYYSYDFSSYNGVPWDVRTRSRIRVPRTSTFSEDDPLNWREDEIHRGTIEFTHRFNDVVATRLAGFASTDHASRVESVHSTGAIPATFVNGSAVPRGTTAQSVRRPRRHLQNDYVFTFNVPGASHRLLVGGEASDMPDIVTSFAGTSSAIDPFQPVFPGTVTVNTTPSSVQRTNNKQLKAFFLETIGLYDDRLLVSFGMSRVRAHTSSKNELSGVYTTPLRLTQDLKQYGAVFKVLPELSVFYGYGENFAPNFLGGSVLPSQLGEQQEVGVKADIVDGRLSLNLAYFDIQQVNTPVPMFPQTTPPSFVLVPGQTSRGIDGDITFSLNKNLDFVGTFAVLHARARSQANSAAPVVVNPVNNVAQKTFGLWTRYKVTDGSFKGASVGIGYSYLSSRAVTNNNNSIVFGRLSSFSLVDLVLGFEHGAFRYAVNLDNVFDKKYDAAVRNESIVVPGIGRNVKASVTWKF